MEQMSMDGLEVVDINYEDQTLPAAVRGFRPAVWKETNTADELAGYCCLLGPDPAAGIFGCGDTPQQALDDWTTHFHQRLKNASPDDELAQEIKDYNSLSKDDVW